MPSMMRRLTSGPKPSWRVRVYMSSRSVGVLGAQPVADAVEAGEVRGGLGGRQHVVGRQRVRRVREVDLAHARRRAPRRALERGVEGVEHARFDALAA